MSRMDKYSSLDTKKRISRNQKLYDEVSDINIDYIDINYNNAVEIDPNSISNNKREDYQKRKQLGDLVYEKQQEEQVDNSVKSEKIYDINEILKRAKASSSDEEGHKKRLINTEYNILSKLDIKKLENEELSKDDLHRLIDTVYDEEKPLKKRISKRYNDSDDLLSDMKDDTVTEKTIKIESNNDSTTTSDIVLTEDISNAILDESADLKNNTLFNTSFESENKNMQKNDENEDNSSADFDNNDVLDDKTKLDEKPVKIIDENDTGDITDTLLKRIEKTEELSKLEVTSKISLCIVIIIIVALLAVGGYLIYQYFTA